MRGAFIEKERVLSNLLKELEPYRPFFSMYSTRFSHNFQKHCASYDKRLSEGAVRTLGIRVYHLMFPCKGSKESLDRFRAVAEDLVGLGEDIKPVFTKTFLAMVSDFADYLSRSGKGMEGLKSLLSLMDVYLTEVDEVYVKHVKALREELGRERENERLIAANLMTKLRGEEGAVAVMSFYREVPIVCQGTVRYAGLSLVTIKVGKCPYIMAFVPGSIVFIKSDMFPKPVKTVVDSVDYGAEELTLSGFEFSEMPQERRRFVRVRPLEEVSVLVRARGRELFGKMADISVGGIGVLFKNPPGLSQGDSVEVEFGLGGKALCVRGDVKYAKKLDGIHRIGVEFHTTAGEEEIIAEYVMKVQLDILKELRLAL